MALSDILSNSIKFEESFHIGKWIATYCSVCGDGSRTKGPRGGWLINDSSAAYHCFNCGVSGNLDLERQFTYSKDMWNILKSFNVDSRYIDKLKTFHTIKDPKEVKKVKWEFNDIPTPNFFNRLDQSLSSNDFAVKCVKHIREFRNLDVSLERFYISSGKGVDTKSNTVAQIFKDRLIIPCTYRNKLLFYQGYDLLGKTIKKYLSCDHPKNGAMFNMDQLDIFDNGRPLYITEGAWDALHLDGIAVMENGLTSLQSNLINKSRRKKILVPDRKGDNKKLMEQAIDNEWHIAFPKLGNAKDVDESIRKYGKLFTLHSINTSIKSHTVAKMFYKSY